jgi:transcriptional regulator with XRE-family HTH domain
MKTFGRVVVAARKAAGLKQKDVAARLHRVDGRKVMAPYLNDLEHDRRNPPENAILDQLGKLLGVSVDILYFYARRLPGDVARDFDDRAIEAAYHAFRETLSISQPTAGLELGSHWE